MGHTALLAEVRGPAQSRAWLAASASCATRAELAHPAVAEELPSQLPYLRVCLQSTCCGSTGLRARLAGLLRLGA